MNRVGLMGLASALAAGPLSAQLPAPPRAGAAPIAISGEVGSYGELYRRSGAPAQRPDETGRVYLNASAVLFGSVRLGLDLIASTEDGTSLGFGGLPGRQGISQFGLHPEWRWGRANLGTFAESYSPLTYNGLQVRGVGAEIHPGQLRLEAFRGKAAGAVAGGATTGSYSRTVTGGHLGFGSQQFGRPSNFIELTAIRALDDPQSLPVRDTTLPPNVPIAGGVVPINPYAVTPQDNLVVGLTGGLRLLAGKIAWRAEVAGAVHTLDVRAAPLDPALAHVPGVLSGLVTPRVGTHADYAYTTELQLRGIRLPGATPRSPRSLMASLGYRYVGPGYTALAVASPVSDLEAVDARASVRFLRWSAQLQGGTQSDNLLGQKLSTTRRLRLGETFALRVTPSWSATLRSSLLTMGNGSRDTLQWFAYHAWSFGMGHALSFGATSRVQSLTIDYDYQNAGDANPRRSATNFSAASVNARLTIRAARDVQVGPAVGLARTRSDTLAPTTRATYGINAAWRLWGGRLTTTGSIGRSLYTGSNTWTGALSALLHVTARDDLVLGAQINRYRDAATPTNAYNERMINLRWARRL